MKLTEEQQRIVDEDDGIIVKALAGAGKTSTLYHFIKTRKPESKILYLAFNKSVQEEALKKFEDIHNVYVHVKTAHSMAYRAMVTKKGYKVEELTPEYVIKRYSCMYEVASHVVKYFVLYSTTPTAKVADVNYRATISNDLALNVYDAFSDEILKMVREIVADMYYNKMPVTHDYYLKLWYLTNPDLSREYDYILFDEGQDASEIMLEIFKSQKCKKVIVGDEHQQIYAWRNAVNSLAKVEGKVLKLSKSFRFEQNIADLAIKVIKWKKELYIDKTVGDFNILGCGVLQEVKSKAVIARTNLTLIKYAIDNVLLKETIQAPYFEGGFKNYSINAMYAPLNDIKMISIGRLSKIKIERLKKIRNIEELKKFIQKTEDIILAQALDLYEIYGNKLFGYIDDLKDMCVEEKSEADTVFTTAHKAKGMEYDSVKLLEDFKSKSDFNVMLAKSKDRTATRKLINEEINLLYVAITRSRGVISLPYNVECDINQ